MPDLPSHTAPLPARRTGLLDRLGHQRADVLGISWGGGLAQQFALRRPRRVRRLVLVATGTGTVMVPGRPRVLRHMLTPRRHRDPGYAVGIAGEIYGGSMRSSPARAAQLLHAGGRPGPDRGYYYPVLAGARWNDPPLLPPLRPPTPVPGGDDDPLTPLGNR